jgi:small subunit ribosomal protein S5
VQVNRVAKVVRVSYLQFHGPNIVGDGKGKVGFGRKAREVPVAIQKAMEAARQNMFIMAPSVSN